MKMQEIVDLFCNRKDYIDFLKNINMHADEYGTPKFDECIKSSKMSELYVVCESEDGRVIPLGKSNSADGNVGIYPIGDDAPKRHTIVESVTYDEDGVMHTGVACFLEGDFLVDGEIVAVFDSDGNTPGTITINHAIQWTVNGTLPDTVVEEGNFDAAFKFVQDDPDTEKLRGEHFDIEYDSNYMPIGIEHEEHGSLFTRKMFWCGYEQDMLLRKELGPKWRTTTLPGAHRRIAALTHVVNMLERTLVNTIRPATSIPLVATMLEERFRKRCGINRGRFKRYKNLPMSMSQFVDSMENTLSCLHDTEAERSDEMTDEAIEIGIQVENTTEIEDGVYRGIYVAVVLGEVAAGIDAMEEFMSEHQGDLT